MGELWRDLVTENPMLIEIQRFRRRFFSFSGSTAVNGAVLALALVGYAGLLMLVFSSRGAIPPIAIVMFQTGIYCLIAPTTMYGAVAGERERRSWDLLIVAPITDAQIIVGKFLGGLTAVGIGYLLLAFPIAIAAVEYTNISFTNLLLAELISLAFSLFLLSITLFFSARAKRGFMALGAVLGIVAILLIIVPIVSGVILRDSGYFELINSFHPFLSQGALMQATESYNPSNLPTNLVSWSIAQILGYLLLTVLFTLWSIRTLQFVENDKKFLSDSNA